MTKSPADFGDGTLTRAGAAVRVKDFTLAELMANPPPVPAYLIDGLLRRGGATMIYGPSGVGKTWFVMTLMLALARGRGCGIVSSETGRHIIRAGYKEGVRVGLIDGENNVGDLVWRASRLCEALKLYPTSSTRADTRIDANGLRAALTAKNVPAVDVEAWVEALSDGPTAQGPTVAATNAPEGYEPVDLAIVLDVP